MSEARPQSSVAARLVASLIDRAREIPVAEVRIGLGYTGVMLADRRAGVAFTFRDLARGGCSVFDGLRPLATRLASELLVLLESGDPIEAAVGLACANALANCDASVLDGDVLDQLELGPEDRVGMVGRFGPLISPIKERARSLTVFERVDHPTQGLHPEAEALEELPRCQVALITATAIITHTIDALLDAAAACRVVAVLGASTPLVPDAFRSWNLTMLSGVVVQQPEQVLRVISEGGGMRQFSPHVRKVTARRV
jgi:uncharacterized protein (DUF4213/DUF364 family)